MNTTLDTQDWYHDSDEYPGIQHLDLHGGHWAEIGPRGRRRSDGWWWAVAEGIETVESGWARNEAGAMAAVAGWAEADRLVAAMTDDLLSAGFDAYGYASATVSRLEEAVARTTQIAS